MTRTETQNKDGYKNGKIKTAYERWTIFTKYVAIMKKINIVFSLNMCLSDERDDQELDIRLEAKLLDEVWNPNLTDSLHYQFQNLRNKIESEVSWKWTFFKHFWRLLGFFVTTEVVSNWAIYI